MAYRLEPVEYDPFAEVAAPGMKFVPVDYDPFAEEEEQAAPATPPEPELPKGIGTQAVEDASMRGEAISLPSLKSLGKQIPTLPGIAYRGIGKGAANISAGVRAAIEQQSPEADAAYWARQGRTEFTPIEQMQMEDRRRWLEKGKPQAVDTLKTFESAYPDPLEGIKDPGILQQATAGVSQFVPAMAVSAINPAIGTAATFEALLGSSYDEYTKQGVDKERAFNAAFLNALAQTPLEMAGNLLQIGALKNLVKTFGITGSAAKRLAAFGEAMVKSMAGEGGEEFLQNYPDEIAKFYAANPDKSPQEIVQHIKDNFGKITKEGFKAAGVGAVGGALMTGTAGAIQAPFAIADYRIGKKREESKKGAEKKGAEYEAQREQVLVDMLIARYRDGSITEEDIRNQRDAYKDRKVIRTALDQLLESISPVPKDDQPIDLVDVVEKGKWVRLPEDRQTGAIVMPGQEGISSAEESAQAFEDAAAEEQRIRQSPVSREGLAAQVAAESERSEEEAFDGLYGYLYGREGILDMVRSGEPGGRIKNDDEWMGYSSTYPEFMVSKWGQKETLRALTLARTGAPMTPRQEDILFDATEYAREMRDRDYETYAAALEDDPRRIEGLSDFTYGKLLEVLNEKGYSTRDVERAASSYRKAIEARVIEEIEREQGWTEEEIRQVLSDENEREADLDKAWGDALSSVYEIPDEWYREEENARALRGDQGQQIRATEGGLAEAPPGGVVIGGQEEEALRQGAITGGPSLQWNQGKRRATVDREREGLEGDNAYISGVVERSLGDPKSFGDIWGFEPHAEKGASGRDIPGYIAGGVSASPILKVGFFKSTPNGVNAAVQFLSNLAVAKTFQEKGFDALNGDVKRLVVSGVRASLHDPEIFGRIVQSVPINVMNDLIGEESSAKGLLRDKDMLLNRLAVNGSDSIPPAVRRFVLESLAFIPGRLPDVNANLTAISHGASSAGTVVGLEGLSASRTDEGFHEAQTITAQKETQPETEIDLDAVLAVVNDVIPGNGLSFDGIQEEVGLQFTPQEGPAKGATFTVDKPDADTIMAGLRHVVEVWTKAAEKTETNPETAETIIDQVANEAATSPKNDLKPPTIPQQNAGNYQKAHFNWNGLDISIENPKGSTRKSKDPNNPWETILKSHYGYIRGTEEGKDGKLDVFFGPKVASPFVYIVNQIDPKTGKFDEVKIMAAYGTLPEARKAYLENYEDGWKGLKNITPVSIDAFKAWLKNGDTTKEYRKAEALPDIEERSDFERQRETKKKIIQKTFSEGKITREKAIALYGKQFPDIGEWLPEVSRGTNLMETISSLQRPGQTRELVQIPKLREAAGLEREEFDRQLGELAKSGKVALHRHDAPFQLSEEERAQLFSEEDPANTKDRGRTYYAGVVPKEPTPTRKAEVVQEGTERGLEPVLIASSPRGSNIILEFDNQAGRKPEVSEIQEYAKQNGFTIEAVELKSPAGKVRDTSRFRVDVFDEKGRLSSRAATELGAKFGGDFTTLSTKARKIKADLTEKAIPEAAQGGEVPPKIVPRVNSTKDGRISITYFDGKGKEVGQGSLVDSVINYIGVNPDERRKGYGKLILEDLVKRGGTKGITATEEGAALMRSNKAFEEGEGGRFNLKEGEVQRESAKREAEGIEEPKPKEEPHGLQTETKAEVEGKLTFKEFAKQYRAAFKEMMKYTPDQAGSQMWAERMAKMADEHPDWVERAEQEEKPPEEKKPHGFVNIKGKARPFTEFRTLERGPNKGKVEVTIQGKKYRVRREEVRSWPEEKAAFKEGDIITDGLIQGKVLSEGTIGKNIPAYRVEVLTGREKGSTGAIIKDQAKIVKKAEGSETSLSLAPTFYSQLSRVLGQKLPNAGYPKQFQAVINSWAKKGEFKTDELKWSGLEEWLAGKEGKITKQEVLDFLKANQVEIREVVKGDVGFDRKALKKQMEEELLDQARSYDFGDGSWWYESIKEEKQKIAGKISATEQEITNEEGETEYLYKYGKEEKRFEYPADEDELLEAFEVTDEDAFNEIPEEEVEAGAQQALDEADFNEELDNAERDFELESEYKNQNPTKFSSWQLPGGENYREVLLTLPVDSEKMLNAAALKYFDTPVFSDLSENQRRATISQMGTPAKYRSSHFPETPNVLAHVRMNDRTGANGEKILFLEEVQSDWHQEGRKKGYKETYEEWKTRRTAEGGGLDSEIGNEDYLQKRYQQYAERKKTLVPPAPFAKTWHEFVLKRMLRYAAENGYDKIAFTTGEQQADRYDLSKQVSKITFSKPSEDSDFGNLTVYGLDGRVVMQEMNESVSKLPDIIGKEITDRLLSSAPTNGMRTIEGPNLKVGGQGMKGFYDKIIPDFLNKYAKRWGARVEETKIETVKEYVPDDTLMEGLLSQEALAGAPKGEKLKATTESVHSLPITPSMRQSVMEQGQPMFSVDVTPREAREVGQIASNIKTWLAHILTKDVLARTEIILKPLYTRADFDPEKIKRSLSEHGAPKEGTGRAFLGATEVTYDRATGHVIIIVKFSYHFSDEVIEKTAYHEGFHVVCRLLLPDSDYQTLVDHFGNEEKAAIAFSKWAKGKAKAENSVIRRVFQTLAKALKYLQSKFKGEGYRSAEAIFEKIWGKEYGARVQEVSASATMASMTEKGEGRIPAGKSPKAEGGVRISDFIGYKDGILYYSMEYRPNVPNAARNWIFNKEHEGQTIFYRQTNNPKEHELGDFKSKNYADQVLENGMSVSQHPGYSLQGHKYTGVVTGDIIGYGADGEPLLQNVKWLHRPTKYNKLPSKYKYENLKKEAPIAYDAIDKAELKHVSEEEFDKLFPNPTRPPESGGQVSLDILSDDESPAPSDLEALARYLDSLDAPRREAAKDTLVKERRAYDDTEQEAIEKASLWLKQKPDVSKAAAIFSQPFHYYGKVPALKRMFQSYMRRKEQNYFGIFNQMNKNADGSERTTTINRFKSADKEEFGRYARYRVNRDRNAIGYKVYRNEEKDEYDLYHPKAHPDKHEFVTHKEAETRRKELRKTLRDKLFRIVQTEGGKFRVIFHDRVASFDTEDAAWMDAIRRELQDFSQKGFSEKAVEALKADKLMVHEGFRILSKGLRDAIAYYESVGLPMPSFTMEAEGEQIQVTLKDALKLMGDIRGHYYPRIRHQGAYMLTAKTEGLNPYMDFFDAAIENPENVKWRSVVNSMTPMGAKIRELAKQGYKLEDMTVKRSPRMSEGVFDMANMVLNLEQVINTALSQVQGKPLSLEALGFQYTERYYGPKHGRMVFVDGPYRVPHRDVFKRMGGRRMQADPGGRWVWGFKNPGPMFEQRLARALTEAKVTLDVDREMVNVFAATVSEQVSDIIKARGHRAHMVRRVQATGKEVTIGYEEDPSIALAKYAQGIAGGEAKKVNALEMVKAFTGTDIPWPEYKTIKAFEGAYEDYIAGNPKSLLSREDFNAINDPEALKDNHAEVIRLKQELDGTRSQEVAEELMEAENWLYDSYKAMVKERRIDAAEQKNAFDQGKAFMRDVLTNEQMADRVVGFFKGLAVFKYLAGRVSAPAINLTALVTSVPGAMQVMAGVNPVRAMKLVGDAGVEYGKYLFPSYMGKLKNLESEAVFREIERRGWDQAQFNREALSALESKVGRQWNNVVEALMMGFSVTERLNRVSTIAAAYRAIKEKNPSMTMDEALTKAKEISDAAHGVYSKGNRPAWARGGGVAGNIGAAAYVFKTFSHNYLLLMGKAWGGWKLIPQHKTAFAWLALSPAVVAGAGAMVGKEALIMAAKALGVGGDDPEEEFYAWLYEAWGRYVEKFGRYGLAGLMGVNLKGSMEIGITDLPTNLEDLLGAPGSMIGDAWDFAKLAGRGDYWKAAEKAPVMPLFLANPLRGIREYTEGVTTWGNDPVYYGVEQITADLVDAILRGFSFNPVGISEPREIQWKEKQVEQKYRGMKDDVYAKIKRYSSKNPEDRTESEYVDLVAEIDRYNNRVMERGLNLKGIPFITKESIKQTLRNAARPPKKERMREMKGGER